MCGFWSTPKRTHVPISACCGSCLTYPIDRSCRSTHACSAVPAIIPILQRLFEISNNWPLSGLLLLSLFWVHGLLRHLLLPLQARPQLLEYSSRSLALLLLLLLSSLLGVICATLVHTRPHTHTILYSRHVPIFRVFPLPDSIFYCFVPF